MSEIIEVVITSETPTIETTAFAYLVFIAEMTEAEQPGKTATFARNSDVAEVFPNAYHPVRQAANAAFSDTNFKPEQFISVRRTPGTSEIHAFEMARGGAPVDGDIVFAVDGIDIVTVPYSDTDTAEAVADKLAAGVNELTAHPFRATVVEETGTFFVLFESQFGSNEYDVELTITGDVTATVDAAKSEDAVASAESIADVLAELGELGVSFFGVSMLSTRPADIASLAEELQGTPLLGAVRKNDPEGDEETDAEAVDHPYYNLKAAGYRDLMMYSHPEPWRFPELRNFAPTISINPDEQASTFALRSPAGLQRRRYANPRASSEAAMRAGNVNFFRRDFGVVTLWEGTVPNGDYGDIVFSEKWLTARMKERGFALIQGAVQSGSKIPYDDDGAAALESEIRGMVQDAIGAGHVTASIDPEYQVPSRADIPTAQVQSRNFPPVIVTAHWAGAVHSAQFRFVLLF